MKEWINGNARFAVTYTTQKKETQKATYQQEHPSSNCLKAGLAQFAEHQKASSPKNSSHNNHRKNTPHTFSFNF
jgi:hypothetical protein